MIVRWRKDLANERSSEDRKSTRLNSSHLVISYAVFCLKKKKTYAHVSCSGRSTGSPCPPLSPVSARELCGRPRRSRAPAHVPYLSGALTRPHASIRNHL